MTRLEIQVAGGDTATPLNLQKRLDWIRAVAGPLEGKSAIDCGCGAGEYVRALAALGADAWESSTAPRRSAKPSVWGGCPRDAWLSATSRPSSLPMSASTSR
jgi:hypothetical protein